MNAGLAVRIRQNGIHRWRPPRRRPNIGARASVDDQTEHSPTGAHTDAVPPAFPHSAPRTRAPPRTRPHAAPLHTRASPGRLPPAACRDPAHPRRARHTHGADEPRPHHDPPPRTPRPPPDQRDRRPRVPRRRHPPRPAHQRPIAREPGTRDLRNADLRRHAIRARDGTAGRRRSGYPDLVTQRQALRLRREHRRRPHALGRRSRRQVRTPSLHPPPQRRTRRPLRLERRRRTHLHTGPGRSRRRANCTADSIGPDRPGSTHRQRRSRRNISGPAQEPTRRSDLRALRHQSARAPLAQRHRDHHRHERHHQRCDAQPRRTVDARHHARAALLLLGAAQLLPDQDRGLDAGGPSGAHARLAAIDRARLVGQRRRTGRPAQPAVARRSAGDAGLDRSTRQRRPDQAGAQARSHPRTRIAVRGRAHHARRDRMACPRHHLGPRRPRDRDRSKWSSAQDAQLGDRPERQERAAPPLGALERGPLRRPRIVRHAARRERPGGAASIE